MAASREASVTAEEVTMWGEKLELATPLIVDLFAQKNHSRDIAAAVENKHQIPPEITLRYIIALARHLRASTDEVDP